MEEEAVHSGDTEDTSPKVFQSTMSSKSKQPIILSYKMATSWGGEMDQWVKMLAE